jgi:hypothetical protein
MIWARSIAAGFSKGDGKALGSALLFSSTWLFSTLALRPLNRGLHEAFDRAPAARDLLDGRGVDLWAELAIRQPGLFSSGFSLFLPMLLLCLAASLYVTAGVYGQAARPAKPAWRTFFLRANRFALPFAAGLLLNALVWGAAFALLAGGLLGLGHAFEGSTDPGTAFRLVLLDLAAAALLVELFRGSVGFFQARYALTDGGEGLGRSFLRALRFVIKRFVPVLSITLFFALMKLLVLWLALFALSPGYATGGREALTALLMQAGTLAVAFLRVAEARSQVEYTRAVLPELEGGARFAVPPPSAGVPEGVPPPEAPGAAGVSEASPAAQAPGALPVDSASGGA